MTQENVMCKFEIISTSNGYMINRVNDDGDEQCLHAPNGDNTFDDYAQAVIALTQNLLRGLIHE